MIAGDGEGASAASNRCDWRDLPSLQSPTVVVQRVMNLVMPIKRDDADGADDSTTPVSPQTKARLVIAMSAERDAIATAMDNLGAVHFARFNIVGDDLHFQAVYDGTAEGYVHDFVVHLGAVFDVIMSFIADWPPPAYRAEHARGRSVSVRDHPAEFVEWVLRHDIPQLPRDVSGLLRTELNRGAAGGPAMQGLLFNALVDRFSRSGNAHLSMHRGYPGRTVAQIRDALDVGW